MALEKAQQFYAYLHKVGRRYLFVSANGGYEIINCKDKKEKNIITPWVLHKLFMGLLYMKLESDDFYKIEELKRRINVNMHKILENADKMGNYGDLATTGNEEITVDNKGCSVDEFIEMGKNVIKESKGENGVFLQVCNSMKENKKMLDNIYKDFPKMKIIKDFAIDAGITSKYRFEVEIEKIINRHPLKNYVLFLKKTKKKKRKKTKRNRKKNKKN